MSDSSNLLMGPGWGNLHPSRFGTPAASTWAQPGAAPPQPLPANPLLAGAAAPPAAPLAQAVPGAPQAAVPQPGRPVGLPLAQPQASPLLPPQVMPQGAPQGAPQGVPGMAPGAVPGAPIVPPELQSRPGMSPGDWAAHVAALYPVGGGLAP